MPSSTSSVPRRVRVSNLCFSFNDGAGRPLFSGVSADLRAGWTAVVGPNGGGKSTLLRLLSGALRPDSGRIELEPRAGLVHHCPQRIDDLTADIEALAWDWEPRAARARARLRLEPDELGRWPTLSAGERKRWQIGAALACEPDLLLLDEPSNHLDAAARAWLLDALRGFGGVGVLVSHDRELIDELCQTTLSVRPWRLASGGYSAARALWTAQDARQIERWEAADERLDRAKARLGDKQVQHAAALVSKRTSRRMKDARDHDARSSLAKGKAAMGERAQAREVARAAALVERAEAVRDEVELRRELGAALKLEGEPCPRPRLLHVREDLIAAGEVPLLRDVELSVERGARVRVHGPNGSGKSTLIAHMLRQATLPLERVFVLPQELDAPSCRALLRECLALPREQQGRLMTILAALGVDPAAARASADPSPGEARKLAIALGLARRVWLLVLDEPSNHLDLPSVERLEEVLSGWDGALLLVTHDERFAAALACETWDILDGRLVRREPAQGATGSWRASAVKPSPGTTLPSSW